MKKNRIGVFGDLEGVFYLDALVDDFDGLSLYLSGEDHFVTVRFDSYLTYRNSDESERIDLVNEVSDLRLNSKLIVTVNESKFIKWIVEESKNIRKDDLLFHYVVLTPNDIVEIVSHDVPEIIKAIHRPKIKVDIEE